MALALVLGLQPAAEAFQADHRAFVQSASDQFVCIAGLNLKIHPAVVHLEGSMAFRLSVR